MFTGFFRYEFFFFEGKVNFCKDFLMYVLVLQIRMWCRIDDEFRFFVKLVGCFSGRFQLSL
jgi:hypothetical protein